MRVLFDARKRARQLPIEDFVQIVRVLMLIDVVVRDELSSPILVELIVEDSIDVDNPDIPRESFRFKHLASFRIDCLLVSFVA